MKINKVVPLLICLMSIALPASACDVCNIFEFKNTEQRSYIGLFYHFRAFNGYDHLNQSHRFLGNRSNQAHELEGSNLFFERKKQDFERYSTFALRANFPIFKKMRANIILPYERVEVYYNRVWSVLEPVSDTTMALEGLGDAIVAFDYNLQLKGENMTHYFIPGLGFKLPTGEYKIRDPEGNLFDPEIQPGSGSLDFIFRLNYTLTNSKWGLNNSVNYKVNGKTTQYRFGNSLNAQSNLFCVLGEQFQVIPQSGLYFEQANKNKEGNSFQTFTGGHTLFYNLGSEFRLKTDFTFQLLAQWPILDKRNGRQIGNAGRLNFALLKNF